MNSSRSPRCGWTCVVLLAALATGLVLPAAQAQDQPPSLSLPEALPVHIPPLSRPEAVQFASTYCFDCHSSREPEAEFNVEKLLADSAFAEARDHWMKVAQRVRANEMPPKESPRPEVLLRDRFATWVELSVHDAVCGDGVDIPVHPLRRLNRAEYSTTLQELLAIGFDPGSILPSEGAGGEGFDNAAETLFLSPIHAEKYLEAARTALEYALRDPDARGQIILVEPRRGITSVDAAKHSLAAFLPRAYRRPVSPEEIYELVPLFMAAEERGESFDSAITSMLQAALCSPHFLFRLEAPNLTSDKQLVGDFEMASRLSYFLWGSMPDQQLFDLAAQGKLNQPDVLVAQTLRMLEDQRTHNFAERFIEQWLNTRELGKDVQPDPNVVRGYDTELEWAIKNEPVLFFRELLVKNESLLNLIDSDFSFLNEKLRRLYAIRAGNGQNLLRVNLPEDSHRGGILTMAATLAVTSYPHRTSPVLRGKWVLETILGTPPAPPPPDVPELPETAEAGKPSSLRQRLELHRLDPVCASCHNSIDPLGFGLDNFDVIGRWRTQVDDQPVDASGQLPDGTKFNGPEELKQVLLARKDQFLRHLTRKVLGYALGRGLTVEDECIVDDITEKVRDNNYLAQTLILQIVLSEPMRYQQAAASGQLSAVSE